MARKRKPTRGGARPGAGRKPDPNHPGMPKANAITLHMPDDLAEQVGREATRQTTSRPDAVRQILRRHFRI